MTIDQIEMLEAIVQTGSMQKAAKTLNKSQPSLSVGIKKIEELYNIQILNRENYRPQLTNEGLIFFKKSQEVLQSYRQLHKTARELSSGIEAQIQLTIDSLIQPQILNRVLSTISTLSRNTQINLNEDILDGPFQALISQKAQIAIGHCPPHQENKVLKKKVGQAELLPVILKEKSIKDLPNIIVTKNTHTKEIREGSTWYVSNHYRKEELIFLGLGWGKISREKIKQHKNKLTIIKEKLHSKIQLDFYLMVSQELPLGPIAKKLWSSF